ncbi:hypothetical protein Dda3937_01749 [Dickeya dadantii 3937]|uniref:CobQ/CobB/MinD/ParA nucleotide binding domain-containing protein n=1 Tax=Dickeya dadantii (strain 3937) TaxID=198628 RepID=E0SAJ7_DICD3|nr:AAA family ATPase [Dickeya dadantii]ADM97055.1 hypothetical protein Dda3937_01749 [Dickeya dadantii 3937]
MIKLIVNTPKGGVGKTTTATNIALLLAQKGFRVWAIDLAGGLLMSQALQNRSEFASTTPNKIEQKETERVPTHFPGASQYDFAVLDTDDSFTVGEDMLLGNRPSWRVISPINPHDRVGLQRIPRDIRALAAGAFLSPSELQMTIVVNMAYGGDIQEGFIQLRAALAECGIEGLLTALYLPHAPMETSPILLNDIHYKESLDNFLRGIGI